MPFGYESVELELHPDLKEYKSADVYVDSQTDKSDVIDFAPLPTKGVFDNN